ncbi:MAG: SRPBCC family protein, partial [Candidatus Eremiobacteraeota bacterium]|nr:SRPBCC family protein [Candidatus Eremiobacteraeota bacterium]
MMNEVFIGAPAERVYDLAAHTERWPAILPHYRSVRIIEQRESQLLVEMAAWRDLIPVRWVAKQWNDGEIPRIRFQHVAGWTKGMDVQWQFERLDGGTRVRIVHELDFRFPIASRFLGQHVVGEFFV